MFQFFQNIDNMSKPNQFSPFSLHLVYSMVVV